MMLVAPALSSTPIPRAPGNILSETVSETLPKASRNLNSDGDFRIFSEYR